MFGREFIKITVLFIALMFSYSLHNGILVAQEETPPEKQEKVLPEVRVEAAPEPAESLTVPSTEQSKDKLNRVPGSTTLINEDHFRERAPSSFFGLEDILSLSPGVFSRNFEGDVGGVYFNSWLWYFAGLCANNRCPFAA